MLYFCLHSLIREYGWRFIRHVAVPHPIRTIRAVMAATRIEFSEGSVTVGTESERENHVVGVGFCLKPLEPPCPSGRANHDCLYLEKLLGERGAEVPTACRGCAIREIGVRALEAGASFYIMTSAKDILMDLFVPALKYQRFSSGLFALCRYSFRPFAVGLLASGIHGKMVPFEHGDCADYKTWLQADRGIKDDRTELGPQDWEEFRRLVGDSTQKARQLIVRQGNVFAPASSSATRTQAPKERSKSTNFPKINILLLTILGFLFIAGTLYLKAVYDIFPKTSGHASLCTFTGVELSPRKVYVRHQLYNDKSYFKFKADREEVEQIIENRSLFEKEDRDMLQSRLVWWNPPESEGEYYYCFYGPPHYHLLYLPESEQVYLGVFNHP